MPSKAKPSKKRRASRATAVKSSRAKARGKPAHKKKAASSRRRTGKPARKTSKAKAKSGPKGAKAVRISRAKPGFKLIRRVADMKKYIAELRRHRRSVALVPTMGSLHDGHLALIHEANRLAKVVVVSVFVNPTQFGPHEDLDRYPRDPAGDRRKIRAAGGDVMFFPDTAEMYPDGFQTVVDVTEVTRDYCGASRPGHFRGVATVVAKLLRIVEPDVAVFGEKDYQQLISIRRMARDLNFDVNVVGIPTVREEDGLAMSSRNSYLSPAQRQQATAMFRGLRKAKRLCESGERDAAELGAVVLDLLREERDLEIDYVAVCDPETLERIPEVDREAVLLAAVSVGDTRLIDNIRLGGSTRRRRR
ncbi:MAG: pantoate--beta-alanine ligase [Deltaproteobacteria bacterium]|nr:pantoate--beta-alanine ligase [Deltaproteobacteria bacterium]